MNKPERILISRTDSIGDVVLTLPFVGAIKTFFPDCVIVFLGRNYTRAVVELSSNIDEFESWDDAIYLPKTKQQEWFEKIKADAIIHVLPNRDIARLAKAARIPVRIGSSGRLYHYFTCNKIVLLSRRNADLHEAQLNFKLLKPLIKNLAIPSLDQLAGKYGINQKSIGNDEKEELIHKNKVNLILHPKSKGSAREWPLKYYQELINKLPAEKFKVFITGTKDEGVLLNKFLEENKQQVTDLTGRFSLSELVAFIEKSDGLVAASTGPLHIASALGKLAIGIYPPIRPMHPGRWSPIGKNAHYLVADKECSDCRKSLSCNCMGEVTPQQVYDIILKNVG